MENKYREKLNKLKDIIIKLNDYYENINSQVHKLLQLTNDVMKSINKLSNHKEAIEYYIKIIWFPFYIDIRDELHLLLTGSIIRKYDRLEHSVFLHDRGHESSYYKAKELSMCSFDGLNYEYRQMIKEYGNKKAIESIIDSINDINDKLNDLITIVVSEELKLKDYLYKECNAMSIDFDNHDNAQQLSIRQNSNETINITRLTINISKSKNASFNNKIIDPPNDLIKLCKKRSINTDNNDIAIKKFNLNSLDNDYDISIKDIKKTFGIIEDDSQESENNEVVINTKIIDHRNEIDTSNIISNENKHAITLYDNTINKSKSLYSYTNRLNLKVKVNSPDINKNKLGICLDIHSVNYSLYSNNNEDHIILSSNEIISNVYGQLWLQDPCLPWIPYQIKHNNNFIYKDENIDVNIKDKLEINCYNNSNVLNFTNSIKKDYFIWADKNRNIGSNSSKFNFLLLMIRRMSNYILNLSTNKENDNMSIILNLCDLSQQFVTYNQTLLVLLDKLNMIVNSINNSQIFRICVSRSLVDAISLSVLLCNCQQLDISQCDINSNTIKTTTTILTNKLDHCMIQLINFRYNPLVTIECKDILDNQIDFRNMYYDYISFKNESNNNTSNESIRLLYQSSWLLFCIHILSKIKSLNQLDVSYCVYSRTEAFVICYGLILVMIDRQANQLEAINLIVIKGLSTYDDILQSFLYEMKAFNNTTISYKEKYKYY